MEDLVQNSPLYTIGFVATIPQPDGKAFPTELHAGSSCPRPVGCVTLVRVPYLVFRPFFGPALFQSRRKLNRDG